MLMVFLMSLCICICLLILSNFLLTNFSSPCGCAIYPYVLLTISFMMTQWFKHSSKILDDVTASLCLWIFFTIVHVYLLSSFYTLLSIWHTTFPFLFSFVILRKYGWHEPSLNIIILLYIHLFHVFSIPCSL